MTSISSRNFGKTFYLMNKPGVGDTIFYDISWRNNISRPYIYLREEIEKTGLSFKITHDCSDLTDAAMVLCFCYVDQMISKNLIKVPKNRRALLLPEPPSLLPGLYHPSLKNVFGTIFVLVDEVVDNQTYFKYYHPHYRVEPLLDIPDFSEKKLGIMIHSNLQSDSPKDLYRERHVLARDFSNPHEFDLFGSGWDGYPIWRGGADKMSVLKNYKFYFAYENTRDMSGYITERIFDAFYGGCVPIYWGAPDITDYVPKECFIDRREFASNADLYQFIKSVDQAAYARYIEAGLQFLKTPKAELFSPRNFAKTITKKLVWNSYLAKPS